MMNLPSDNGLKARRMLLDVVSQCSRDRYAFFPQHAHDLLNGKSTRGIILFGLRSVTFLEHLNAVKRVIAAVPGLELRAVVDDDPSSLQLPTMSCPILSAREFFDNAEKYSGCLAVDRYCTWLPGVKYKTRFKQLGMPFLRLEQFLNAPQAEKAGGFYRQNSDYVIENIDELMTLEGSWADEKSAEVYYTVLAGFGSMDFTYFALSCDDHNERYFPSDVGFTYANTEVLVDCGSHHGGEILIFAGKTGHHFRAVHSFEPDLANFRILSANMSRYMAEQGRHNIYCYSVGAYDRNDYLRFSGADTILTISDERAGDGKGVFVSRLDDMVDEVTHLRLEVEGAELQALRGAAGLVRQHRPKLCVSAYHRPNDFPVLCKQIAEFDLGYGVRVRHQSLEAGVLCLYCH